MIWMKWFIQYLDLKHDGLVVHCDSQSVMGLRQNTTYYSWMKYIDVDIIGYDKQWQNNLYC